MNRKCIACNINIDIINYKKVRNFCKKCYKKSKKRKKNKNNTLIGNQQPNVEKVNNNKNNNGTLIIIFPNCGKTYLMK